MEFFKVNTKIDFMRQRKWAALVSAIIFVLSIVSLGVNGLNFGLDFTGGTQLQFSFSKPVDLTHVRKELASAGFDEAVVQNYGTARDISVKVAPKKGVTQKELQAKIEKAVLPGEMTQASYIGPQVGKALMTNGVLAVLVSLIATMIYIALRFEYRFALSAAIALIHDPVLILGIFSFFHLEFNLIVLAAVLTVIGYSLNDTIVVYDRVRENFRKMRKGSAIEIMNRSINQTLSRTIMTSGLTLLVVVALYLFGGEMIHGFSIALIIGIVVGTYSSIYIAGALAVLFGLDRKHLLAAKRNIEDETP